RRLLERDSVRSRVRSRQDGAVWYDRVMVSEEVTMEGHLIDSDILRRAFGRIVEEGGEFEVLEFRVGRTNLEPSFARLPVKGPDPEALDTILEGLSYLGAQAIVEDARFAPAEADG